MAYDVNDIFDATASDGFASLAAYLRGFRSAFALASPRRRFYSSARSPYAPRTRGIQHLCLSFNHLHLRIVCNVSKPLLNNLGRELPPKPAVHIDHAASSVRRVHIGKVHHNVPVSANGCFDLDFSVHFFTPFKIAPARHGGAHRY